MASLEFFADEENGEWFTISACGKRVKGPIDKEIAEQIAGEHTENPSYITGMYDNDADEDTIDLRHGGT